MQCKRFLLALTAAPLMLMACDNAATPPDNAAAEVTVTATGFSPARVTLEHADSTAGGEDTGLPLTVQWELGVGQHNITFEDGTSSGPLADGATFERVFRNSQPGTYRYRCTLHSSDFLTGQVGEIVVVP